MLRNIQEVNRTLSNNCLEETIIDLNKVITALFKKIHIILLTAVLFGTAFFLYLFFVIKPLYASSISIYVSNSVNNNNTSIALSDITASKQLVNTYAEIVKSKNLLNKVCEYMDCDISANEIKSILSVDIVEDTEIFNITITYSDPYMTAGIANAFADTVVSEMPDIVKGSSVKIIDYADVPNSKIFPNYIKGFLVGFLIGAVLFIAIISVKEIIFQLRVRQ